MSGTERIADGADQPPTLKITGDGTTSDTLHLNELFVQLVAVRGNARIRLITWVAERRFFILRPPMCDPDLLTLLGIGSFFEPVLSEDVMCICVASSSDSKPEGDIAEIAEFLRGSAQ